MRRVGSGSRRSAAFAAVTRTLYRFGRSVNTRPAPSPYVEVHERNIQIYTRVHQDARTRHG